MKTCSVESCGGKRVARGWCAKHYRRWQRNGDPLVWAPHYSTAEEAFLARTEPLVGDPGCIAWTGATSGGYGVLVVNGRKMLAHRYAWEQANGSIPDGMVIDHRCWEPSCVNLDHLRVCTQAENTRNLSGAHKGRDLPRGVHRDGRKYRAAVRHNGKLHYLGLFDTIAEASAAAATKRSILFGEYAGRA